MGALKKVYRSRQTAGDAGQPLSTLNEIQRDVVAIVRAGCLRTTACQCVDWDDERLRIELSQSKPFERELLRAEAALEASHLRNVLAAAQDKKNWRASVWWLERRFPERYADQKRPSQRVGLGEQGDSTHRR